MRTLIFPKKSVNPYIKIINNSLNKVGIDTDDIDQLKILQPNSTKYKVINLNWFENVDTDSQVKSFLLFIRQWLRIESYRIKNIKIIYTFHNIVAHDSKNLRLNRILINKLCKSSTAIVILSSISKKYLEKYLDGKDIENKVTFIGHPSYSHYFNQYKPLPYEEAKKLRLLFFGNVRPYKNIELLLEAARKFQNRDIEFLIIGKPCDENYKKELISLAEGLDNIKYDFRYIADDEICRIYQNCDATIIPLDIKSSLNSGSILLSFSLGRTTIAPFIGTLHDFKTDDFYTYQYSDRDSHLVEIVAAINQIYQQWKVDPEILKNKGESLYEQINQYYSEDIVGNKYLELYNKITADNIYD